MQETKGDWMTVRVELVSGRGAPKTWNWWDTGAGATVAQEPNPGPRVGHRCRSHSGTDLRGLWACLARPEGFEPPTLGLEVEPENLGELHFPS